MEPYALSFLKSNSFSHWVDTFESESILSFQLFFDLTPSHLKEMKFKIGDRIRFLKLMGFLSAKKAQLLESVKNANYDVLPIQSDDSDCVTMCVGHRGACGTEPENTLRSFAKALDLGVHGIELDVHICKSGEIVVIHDETVDRTTNGSGTVSEMTLEELQALDAGGDRIPTLNEVFDLVDQKVFINVELKGLGTAKPVADLIASYKRKGWSEDRFFVTSFKHDLVSEFKYYAPTISCGLLLRAEMLGFAAMAEAMDMQAVVTHRHGLSRELIIDAHSRGLKVMVYTVNDQEEINLVKEWKVDGIITNFPERF
eukprot:TRINITY_DN535_c0_g1_i1.p1 TRINITY_DN535_c0_g1~~TRINITY_DN535_c0_g1_i1.p1  ORF type:complete len:313 (+),score=64.88 TRINITY_DN535_c0_g1_i1:979-1917(+)